VAVPTESTAIIRKIAEERMAPPWKICKGGPAADAPVRAMQICIWYSIYTSAVKATSR
jgi:hypothetical protein